MATRMVSALLPARRRRPRSPAPAMSSVTSMNTWSPSWITVEAVGSVPMPNRIRYATRAPVASSRARSGRPIQSLCTGTSMIETVLVGSRKISTLPSGTRWRQHPVGGPADGGHRRDAEPLVDLGPPAGRRCGRRPGTTPNVSRASRAEMMLELSPLETAAKASARSMPACAQHLAVEADAGHGEAGEVGPEPAEGVGVLVDDGDRVAAGLQAVRERRADPAAAHDHDVHR